MSQLDDLQFGEAQGAVEPWKLTIFPSKFCYGYGRHVEVSWNGGTRIAGWLIKGKIPMENGWFGATPMT